MPGTEEYVNERQVATTVTVNQEQVEQEVLCKAYWIIGTNVLNPAVLSDRQPVHRLILTL